MDTNTKSVLERRMERTIKNLEKNQIQAFYVEKKEDVPAKVAALLPEGCTVSAGGSMSLVESGVTELLSSGRYQFKNRDREGITPEEREQIQRETFFMDAYCCSANALTEKGEIYNVDGNGNRVAAIAWGPKSVIMVVGINKLVKDIGEAVRRGKSMAAPSNATRLSCDTPCHHTGECSSFLQNPDDITAGCGTDARICCQYLITGYQRQKGRIKVILVGEELGY